MQMLTETVVNGKRKAREQIVPAKRGGGRRKRN